MGCIRARAEPVCGLGKAGFVVEDDLAGGLVAIAQVRIDAIDADVEAEWADVDVAQLFFEGLDGEGCAFGGFVVEPLPQKG